MRYIRTFEASVTLESTWEIIDLFAEISDDYSIAKTDNFLSEYNARGLVNHYKLRLETRGLSETRVWKLFIYIRDSSDESKMFQEDLDKYKQRLIRSGYTIADANPYIEEYNTTGSGKIYQFFIKI